MDFGIGRPDTLIILASDQGAFYEFLKPRQEADEESLVVLLDRRLGDRCQNVAHMGHRRERRASASEAAFALMRVLGFTVLHREGDRYTV